MNYIEKLKRKQRLIDKLDTYFSSKKVLLFSYAIIFSVMLLWILHATGVGILAI